MKYAIIADIHGNLPALRAVLQDAGEQGAEGYLLCGDYFMCLPWTNEVLEIICRLKNAYAVSGNEDLYFDKCIGKDLEHPDDSQYLAIYWAYRTITEKHKKYILNLPEKLQFSVHGMPVYMAHGAKTYVHETLEERLTSHVADYFREHVYSHAAYQKFIANRLNGNEQFQEKIDKLGKGIYVFGHSHLQWYYEKDGRWFINPGSVGFPLDGNSDSAYSLLTIDADGSCTVEQRRVAYDRAGTVEAARKSGLHKFAPEWTELVIEEVETAYEQIAFFLRIAEQYADKKGDSVRPYKKETWCEAYSYWKRRKENDRKDTVYC